MPVYQVVTSERVPDAIQRGRIVEDITRSHRLDADRFTAMETTLFFPQPGDETVGYEEYNNRFADPGIITVA